MIRFLLSAFLAVFLATVAVAETRMVNSPGDGYLNLRTGPGSGYDIVLRMDHGSLVDILETRGKWRRVHHLVSGAQGWAFGKYLLREDAGTTMMRVYSPGDGYLNLRSGPGGDFAILRRMYNGDQVEIVERKGNWVRVYHQSGAEGWAFARYLRK
jgi:N-acetylmuramoyl-L-alanine amidase